MPTVTLDDLRSRLITRMGEAGADVSTADRDWGINEARRRTQRKIDLYWSQETGATFTTGAGTRNYALSSVLPRYHKAEQIYILDGSTRVRLVHLTRVDEIWQYAPVTGETRKRPEAWLRHKSSIRLMPTPDAAYTVSVDYQAYLADLVSANDRDDLSDNCAKMILDEAASLLMMDRTRWQEAQAWEGEWRKELKDWHDDMVEEELGGEIVVSSGMHTSNYQTREGYRRYW